MLLNVFPNPLKNKAKQRRQRRQIRKELTALWAVFHWHAISKDDEDIASAIGVSVDSLRKLQKQKLWTEALDFWAIIRKALHLLPHRRPKSLLKNRKTEAQVIEYIKVNSMRIRTASAMGAGTSFILHFTSRLTI